MSRVVTSGICSYQELKQMETADLFKMLELLEWKDYAEAFTAQAAKRKG